MTLPFVSCLCPTYKRPQLLIESVKYFLDQDYPADRKELIIYDDSPESNPIYMYDDKDDQVQVLQNPTVRHLWFPQRFPSLTNKFNEMLKVALGEIICVWEDDDGYEPWHISTHVKALEQGSFSKPSIVNSDYPGHIVQEKADGRFHASMAFSRSLADLVGGWPDTDRADFDQQMIARLTQMGKLVDPIKIDFRPSYCFKWHTNHYHGQHFMRSPDDTGWYRRVGC